MTESQTYSVRELANWILEFAEANGQRLTNMALNKLIYFAYEYALQTAGRKLTDAKIEAWDHGPVFREIYGDFKKFGSEPISDRATRYNPRTKSVENVIPAIDSGDLGLIVEAIGPMIRMPAFILREISHDSRGAWFKVWNHTTSSNPGMEITDEIIMSSGSTASIVK